MDANVEIEKALSPLGKEELHLLLEYIREWNTKPKLCHIAQFVLYQVFSILPPTEVVEVLAVAFLACFLLLFFPPLLVSL